MHWTCFGKTVHGRAKAAKTQLTAIALRRSFNSWRTVARLRALRQAGGWRGNAWRWALSRGRGRSHRRGALPPRRATGRRRAAAIGRSRSGSTRRRRTRTGSARSLRNSSGSIQRAARTAEVLDGGTTNPTNAGLVEDVLAPVARDEGVVMVQTSGS
eukprot:15444053-Alexandrium_andersonii.AAC.1